VQGHHLMGYVSARFGRAKRNRWLRVLSSGRSLDEGTREVLGLSFEELSDGWRATLPAPAEAVPPATDPPK
jgi:hypothetical protein